MPNLAFVDAVQLNTAMSATADAIRGKTGESSSITWNMSSGFASAIEEIVTGGTGMKFISPFPGEIMSDDKVVAVDFYNMQSYANSYPYSSYYTNYRSLISVVVSEANYPDCISIYKSAFYCWYGLQTANFANVTNISSNAFYYCSNLETISFPNVVSIGELAFYGCSKLSSVEFGIENILGTTFGGCSNLNYISFPNAITISRTAFDGCSSLTSVYFPNVEKLYGSVFKSCHSLYSAYFPKCTSVDSGYLFEKCSSLKYIRFPLYTLGYLSTSNGLYSLTGLVTTYVSSQRINIEFGNTDLYSVHFYYSSGTTKLSHFRTMIEGVSFPSCTSLYYQAFYSMQNLNTASFPSCTTIGGEAFYSCGSFYSLYLLGSSVANLTGGSYAFYGTPIMTGSTPYGSGGNIYVPQSLVNTYKAATNWTYFSNRFIGLTDNQIAELS